MTRMVELQGSCPHVKQAERQHRPLAASSPHKAQAPAIAPPPSHAHFPPPAARARAHHPSSTGTTPHAPSAGSRSPCRISRASWRPLEESSRPLPAAPPCAPSSSSSPSEALRGTGGGSWCRGGETGWERGKAVWPEWVGEHKRCGLSGLGEQMRCGLSGLGEHMRCGLSGLGDRCEGMPTSSQPRPAHARWLQKRSSNNPSRTWCCRRCHHHRDRRPCNLLCFSAPAPAP